jgi:hypothetical protein
LAGGIMAPKDWQFHTKKISMMDSAVDDKHPAKNIEVACFLISRKPKVYINQLTEVFFEFHQ